jgi:hypothetical protein
VPEGARGRPWRSKPGVLAPAVPARVELSVGERAVAARRRAIAGRTACR